MMCSCLNLLACTVLQCSPRIFGSQNQRCGQLTSLVRPCRVTALAFAGAAVPGSAAASPEQPADRLPLLVSAAADRSLRLWNLSTMQRLRVLYKRPAEVTALAATRCLPCLALPCTLTMAPQQSCLVCMCSCCSSISLLPT